MAKGKGRGSISKSDILDAAFALFEAEGHENFSVRKVAAGVNVDPMTVLHHFGSKRELLRAIADRAVSTIVIAPATDDWRKDLKSVGDAYRELAMRYPRVFRLHFEYHGTGPADHKSAEIVYRAILRCGRTEQDAAGLGLAFYAMVLGIAQAETEGLLMPITDVDEKELMALCPDEYRATRSLVPSFKRLNPTDAFDAAIELWLDGLAAGRPHDPSSGARRSRVKAE